MKVAIVQMRVIPGNIRRNLEEILRYITLAKQAGAELVIFPELATCGYLLGDLFEEEGFIREIAVANETIRRASDDIAVIWGSLVIDESRINEDGRTRKYNAVCIAQNGKWVSNGVLTGYMPKTNLPKYRIFADERHFHPSYKLAAEKKLTLRGLLKPFTVVLDRKDVRLAFTVCEDLWDDEYQIKPALIYKHNGADMLINVSCSPWTEGKSGARERMLQKRANETGLPIIYVATVGLQNTGKNFVWFDGGSSFTSRSGSIVWRAEDNEESLTVIDPYRMARNYFAPNEREIAETYYAIVGAMREFYAPFGRVILGLSGGIDSALTLPLLVEAVGKEKILCVNMPSRHNSETTRRLAAELAANFDVEYKVIPIEGALIEFAKAMESAGYGNLAERAKGDAKIRLALENEQARIRGAGILAFIAQLEGGVVANTGNKTELVLNYFTLHGDAVGAAAFLGDQWKGKIYALANYYNERRCWDVIPKEVIGLRPSAELSEEQSVDKGLGDPIFYPYHDKLLQAFLEKRHDPEWVLRMYESGMLEKELGCYPGTLLNLLHFLGGGTDAFIENLEWAWRQFHTSFKHMFTPPVFLATRRAIGSDYRETIGEAYFTDAYYKLKKEILGK